MLDKLLNDFKEKMVAEDFSNNSIKNYISDIKNFYKWYMEIDSTQNLKKAFQLSRKLTNIFNSHI